MKIRSQQIVRLANTMCFKSTGELIRCIDGYQDALKAGLLLKYEFPHDEVKLCETHCEEVKQDSGVN